MQTAHEIQVGKGTVPKAASIEVLVVSKFRAAQKRRGTDDADLRTLAQKKYDNTDWDALKVLTRSEIEFQSIKMAIDAPRKQELRF